MLKIVTDPTKYPIREVDLTEAAGGLVLSPVAQPQTRDLRYERPDGGFNVAYRARRVDAQLEAVAIDAAQAEAVHRVCNLSPEGDPRASAYLFPPFDASTILSFPLQDSLKGWKHDPATETLVEANLSLTRSSAVWGLDSQGRFIDVAGGEPRFMPGPMGRALLVNPAVTNECNISHPTSGTPGWSAGTGSPTVEWDSGVYSPDTDPGGTLRVRAPGGGIATVTTSGTISALATDRTDYAVYLKGNARVIVSWATADDASSSTGIQLSPTEWTRIDITRNRTGTATAATYTITLLDDGQDRTIWIGSHFCRSYADDNERQQPVGPVFSNYVKDTVNIAPPTSRPGATTITVCSTIPLENSRCRWWFLSGGGGDSGTVEFLDNKFRALIGLETLELEPSIIDLRAAEGRPCVITVRQGLEEDGQKYRTRLQVAYTLEDGGPVLRWTAELNDSDLADWAPATAFTLGSFGTNEPGMRGLSWLRYDGAEWTDRQLETWERCLLEAGFRDVFRLTQGRKFVLGDPDLEPLKGTQYHKLTLPAQERAVDSELAVVT